MGLGIYSQQREVEAYLLLDYQKVGWTACNDAIQKQIKKKAQSGRVERQDKKLNNN